MIIRELTTNACKYRSLCTAGGQLQVQWELASTAAGEPARRLHLLANFGAQSATQAAAPPGALVYSSGAAADAAGLRLERGAVHATLEDVAGG